METTQEKKGIWSMIDRIQGDKVIWMIFILLVLYSIVTIFSSTTLLATDKVSRLDIFKSQMFIVVLGVGIVFLLYKMKVGLLRMLSQAGFVVSLAMLCVIVFMKGFNEDVNGAFFAVPKINGAYRFFEIKGFQIHVYEFVKVGMVVYLSWAVQASKEGTFRLANFLSRIKKLEFLGKPWVQRLIYIHLPIIVVTLLIMTSGFSSAVFIGTIMIATILVGGIPLKDIRILFLTMIAAAALSFVLWKVTGWEWLGARWGTVEDRIENFFRPGEGRAIEKGTKAWDDYVDDLRQPEGAKIAVKEGGIIGKGPGRSTQKYTVSQIFSDYMFCFIVEEYGFLFGALPLIILYVSLLARGSIIVRNCEKTYAKTAMAGLTMLITLQAMMHMYINVGLGPLTGQTLPIISHGKSSFLAFCIAFGVILSISRMAKARVAQAAEKVATQELGADLVREGLEDLDSFEDEVEKYM